MLFSAVTPEHYLRRIEETRRRMVEKGIDLLVVLSDAYRSGNSRYLTGVKPYCGPMIYYYRYAPLSVVAIPLDDNPILYIPLEKWAKRDVAGTLREKPFINVEPLREVLSGLRRLGGKAKNIGYEGRNITPWTVYEDFRKAVGKDMVDVDILEIMRRVKSDIEIKLMEIASNINDRICEELVHGIIRYGVTEKEVMREIEAMGHSLGADYVDAQCMIGRHIDFGHPTDATPVDGDILSLHVILSYEGYFSDNDRIIGFGHIKKEEEELAEIAKAAFWNGLRAMKPGMNAADIFKAANDTSPLVATHAHAIGIEGEETLGAEIIEWGVLQEGMAFTYSPVAYNKEIDLEWSTEDVVVITDTGARVLTKFPIDYIMCR